MVAAVSAPTTTTASTCPTTVPALTVGCATIPGVILARDPLLVLRRVSPSAARGALYLHHCGGSGARSEWFERVVGTQPSVPRCVFGCFVAE